MEPITHVATAPPKPLLIFDGDCRFCCTWIQRWKKLTREKVDYLPFQSPEIATRFPEIPHSQFEQAVQLIETSGQVSSAAAAVFRSLSYHQKLRWPLWCYQKIPGICPLTEAAYRFVARHRPFFSKLTG